MPVHANGQPTALHDNRVSQFSITDECFALAAEVTEDGVWDLEVLTGKLTVNPQWLAMLGYEVHEFTGHLSFWEPLCHPEDAPEVQNLIGQLLDGRLSVYRYEHRLRHREGHYVWVLGRGKVVTRDSEGTALRVVGTNVDISERKRLERGLEEKEAKSRKFSQRLQALVSLNNALSQVETLDDLCRMAVERGRTDLGFDRLCVWFYEGATGVRGSWGTDENGNLRDERHRLLPINPLHLQVMSGTGQAIVQENGVLVNDTLDRLGRGCSVHAGLWDGKTVIGHLGADNFLQRQPWTTDDSELIRLFAASLGHLCTRKRLEQMRQQVEETLRQSEERLRLALDAGGMATWDWDLVNDTNHWNAEMYRMYGYEPYSVEVKYETWAERILPQDRHRTEAVLRDHLETGGELHIEYRALGPGDALRWMEVFGRIERNVQGQAVRSYGVIIDITERKRAEEERAYLMESANCLLWSADVKEIDEPDYFDWDTSQISPELAQRFLPLDVLPGQSYSDAFYLARPDEDRHRCDRITLENIRAGRSYSQEFRVYAADGSTRWMHESIQVTTVQPGQRWKVVAVCVDITERKRIEEDRVHMMESANCLLWNAIVRDVDDPDSYLWEVHYISDELAQRFLRLDVKPGQTYGAAFYLARPEEDRARCNPEANKNISLGRSYTQEFRAYAADGSLHWLHESIHVETVEPGKVWHLVGVCVDITDQKATEEALRESESRLNLGIYVAGLAIAEIDYTKDSVLLTPEAAALFGLPPEVDTISRATIHDLFHPAERSELLQQIEQVLSPESDGWFALEHRIVRRDQQVRWLSVRKQIIFDRNVTPARPLRGMLVAMDITDRKEAEIALREEKELLSKTTVTVPGAIVSYQMRSDGTVALPYASPNIREIYGVTPEELATDPAIIARRRHPDDVERIQQAIEESMRTLTMFHLEFRVIHPEKGVIWIEARTMPTREPNGTTLWYGYLADVTERKRAEEAVIQLNAELEDRVAQRTAELALAKDVAEEANRAKSEFLSRMSHELRTPLNSILGFGQILERRDLDTRSLESVGHILNGGRHLLNLINEILDIARVEAGHIELSPEPIALHEIVPEVCALVYPLAAKRGIRLEEGKVGRDDLFVVADRQRLKQVLMNLLSNAIKYNREGGEVEVSASQNREGWVTLAVRDTGPGIAPEDLPKLFTPFERLHAESSDIEGSGLGLVLSQRLMGAMGGTLRAESTLGRGSTFTLELPEAISPDEPSATLSEITHDANDDRNAERTYTVLCIEDNAASVRLMEAVFEERPEITLLVAMQGSIGLDLARQHEPDLILLDLNLPDMHGSEILDRLQQTSLTRDIPVVIFSADATPSQVERLLTNGAREYLTKPLDIRLFLQTLDTILHPT